MKRLIYQVAIDMPEHFELCIDSVRSYARRCQADHIVQRAPELHIRPTGPGRSAQALSRGYLPIFEKENALRLLDVYDEILILDADVYVRDGAPVIFDSVATLAFDFAGVPERDIPATTSHQDKVRKYSKGQYDRLPDVDWRWDDRGAHFYNMGVMLLRKGIRDHLNGQTPLEFIRRPEFERFVNGEGHWKWSTDQTLLNWWVKSSGMLLCDLDWRYNALYSACPRVPESWFVHFFLSSKMAQGGREIPEIIERL